MTPPLVGLHHVSSLSAQIGRSNAFYTQVLGMRPVIKTVNQDDPSMYHLFFADGEGRPGSEMTVFDLPHAAREHSGSKSITQTTFRVAGTDVLDYWADRLTAHGVAIGQPAIRDGRRVLDFADPVGTQLSLIDDGGLGTGVPWMASPIEPTRQLRGLGYVVITVPELGPTDTFLTQALGLREDHTFVLASSPRHRVHVYLMGDGGADAEVHVIVRDDIPVARYGSGGVHHVALRMTDASKMPEWVDRFNSLGYHNSGIVDRHYFTSLYVREPNHVLFELATDGPGFEVDGPIDPQRLSLPPSLEPRRAEIEGRLTPLVVERFAEA